MTLLGLGKMRMPYAPLQSEIEDCLTHLFPRFNEQEVSTAIYALGLMGCSWTSIEGALLTKTMHFAALATIPKMTSQALFLTLRGLADMGAKWPTLQADLRKVIELELFKALASQQFVGRADASLHVASMINSLGRMGAVYSELPHRFHNVVQGAFIKLHEQFNPQGLANFIYGYDPLFPVCVC